MKNRALVYLGGLLISLQLFSGGALAYNVSGTIQNNSGNGSSRVFIILADSEGSSLVGLGTSITSIANGGSANFTIQGVPAGSYQVAAFMDVNNTGSLHINDPANSTGGSVIVTGDTPVGTIILPSISSPTPPTAVGEINVATTTNGALIAWNGPTGPYNGDGPTAELADSYTIYWGTSANPGNGGAYLGSRNVPAGGGDYHVFIGGLTTSPLYFGIMASNGAGTAYASTGQIPIAPATGGTTVTGRVYSSGITKSSSTPLYIALQGQTTGAFYIGSAANPSDIQSWTITGVQPDTYSTYVILDMANDGMANVAGYITGPGVNGLNNVAPSFTVLPGDSTVNAPDVTLKSENSTTAVTTFNYNNSSYELQFRTVPGLKRPVAVIVNSGPNITGPIDLGLRGNHPSTFGNRGGMFGFSTRPSVGDTYSLTISYSDSSQETVYPKVTGVVSSFPNLIFPSGNTSPIVSEVTPFAWRTPSSPPAGYYDYYLWMNDNSYPIWGPQDNSPSDMPATQLSIPFNVDGSAPALIAGNSYNWGITVNDGLGNEGVGASAIFTPQSGGPVISSFTPTSGKAGDSITINGSGFFSQSVTFGGVQVTSLSTTCGAGDCTQIIATVPANAPVGPITVTSFGKTCASADSFQNYTTFTGTVANAAGTPISGATVTLVNSSPAVTTSTNGSGVYTINIPSGVPISLKFSVIGYHDNFTANFVLTSPAIYLTPTNMRTDADITSFGFSVAEKGLIATRVLDWDTDAAIQGATVTATSFLHPDTPYTVYYSNPTGSGLPVTGPSYSTYTDGRFYVPNVDEGDIVTVRTTVAGYASWPRTYATHRGAVSQTRVVVVPKPVVTASPPGGNISDSQAITLTVSNAVGGDTYAIYYTTDGSDPTTSGTRTLYTSPFTLDTGDITLRFYAINTTHYVIGNIGSASYTVAPSSYNLTLNINGNGTVTNTNPSGPILSTTSDYSNTFSAGSPFTLHATPSSSYLFGGWSSATGSASSCSDKGDCSFTLGADTSLTATFTVMPPVKVPGSPDAYYSSLGQAYASVGPGSSLTMETQATTFTDGFNLNNTVNVLLTGGYNSNFDQPPTLLTTIQDGLTVGLGSLTIANIVVK